MVLLETFLVLASFTLCIVTLLYLENIAFSSTSGDIVGYVDFDDQTLTALAHSKDAVATHMLAFFLRGNS